MALSISCTTSQLLLCNSAFQAAVNATKLVVGVGSFALPKAFELAGMVGGILGIPLLALWCTWCLKIMVQVRDSMGLHTSYTDVGKYVVPDMWAVCGP